MTYGTLTDAEARDLRALAGIMIPASSAHGVPGADDALIFADILKSLERDTADAQMALKHLRELSGGAFAELAPERRTEVAMRFRHEGGAPLFALNRVVLLCYYRDDRVMRALGQEPRSPFPKGHVVEQGDWSLLDPVRKRAPMWRQV
ncbi:hypothetical protein [Reyranella sp.]|jgi:hypothetical protein|uniref:hypothetical protein n=1 Tax=Reyranella sp. TaxID=1929291 RepID=UPI000BD1E8F1|nr:hypothetical protein [Reyranella sp.]OYY46041.1 MAG: hypothetical protein B7Y57_04090 [Rhodospirillales bacterium 35-66-84]OYZ96421.1 MAG: hypothetical protein B7Y08_04450 [Rhodospirillales bacterium 24-66-33]OZB28416.1 MAG: hypothetical protein B7X63_00695 [Rhodospirillales bacterium 39-66-50]HQS14375.1 hypothetical protein [Reyranella sp.]HQT11371.1 hypothetical protein [Reyranella sp.]